MSDNDPVDLHRALQKAARELAHFADYGPETAYRDAIDRLEEKLQAVRCYKREHNPSVDTFAITDQVPELTRIYDAWCSATPGDRDEDYGLARNALDEMGDVLQRRPHNPLVFLERKAVDPNNTFTFAELRIALTAFAMWLLKDEVGEGNEVELVDKFIRETT